MMARRTSARFTAARFSARFATARFTTRFFSARFATARFTTRLFTARFATARFTTRFFSARFATARFTAALLHRPPRDCSLDSLSCHFRLLLTLPNLAETPARDAAPRVGCQDSSTPIVV